MELSDHTIAELERMLDATERYLGPHAEVAKAIRRALVAKRRQKGGQHAEVDRDGEGKPKKRMAMK